MVHMTAHYSMHIIVLYSPLEKFQNVKTDAIEIEKMELGLHALGSQKWREDGCAVDIRNPITTPSMLQLPQISREKMKRRLRWRISLDTAAAALLLLVAELNNNMSGFIVGNVDSNGDMVPTKTTVWHNTIQSRG